MRQSLPVASLAALSCLAVLAAAAVTRPAAAADAEKQPVTVENGASRVVECAVVVDGKTRTMLKIRPGKRWADSYDPRRTIQLVCERAKEGVYRVHAGATYRFSDADRRVALAETVED